MSFVKDIRLVQRSWKEGNQGIHLCHHLTDYRECVVYLMLGDHR